MDKQTRALMMAEDNAVRLSMLERSAVSRPATVIAESVTDGAAASFGKFETFAPTLAVIVGQGTVSVKFCGESVASGSGSVVAVLPIGKGALEIESAASPAVAALIGSVKKIE